MLQARRMDAVISWSERSFQALRGGSEPRRRSNHSAKINGIFNFQLNYIPRMKAGGQIGWSVRDQARSLLK